MSKKTSFVLCFLELDEPQLVRTFGSCGFIDGDSRVVWSHDNFDTLVEGQSFT